MRIKSKIENLRNKIEKANQEYYVLNRPSMSDYKYDELMNELIELEKKYPKYRKSSSPTNKDSTIAKSKSPPEGAVYIVSKDAVPLTSNLAFTALCIYCLCEDRSIIFCLFV